MDKLADYYARRASEYEQIYARPDRRRGVELLQERLAELFAGRRVLELACGTGYWTEVIAGSAAKVDALDFNEETLAIARLKKISPEKVKFAQGDAYALPDFGPCHRRRHDALFAGFWWSHVPLERLDAFLQGTVAALACGALVAFADNLYIEGSSTPASRRDANGNSYQTRSLRDGSRHEVLKNFPSEDELRAHAEKFGRDFRYQSLDCYWLMTFTT